MKLKGILDIIQRWVWIKYTMEIVQEIKQVIQLKDIKQWWT